MKTKSRRRTRRDVVERRFIGLLRGGCGRCVGRRGALRGGRWRDWTRCRSWRLLRIANQAFQVRHKLIGDDHDVRGVAQQRMLSTGVLAPICTRSASRHSARRSPKSFRRIEPGTVSLAAVCSLLARNWLMRDNKLVNETRLAARLSRAARRWRSSRPEPFCRLGATPARSPLSRRS